MSTRTITHADIVCSGFDSGLLECSCLALVSNSIATQQQRNSLKTRFGGTKRRWLCGISLDVSSLLCCGPRCRFEFNPLAYAHSTHSSHTCNGIRMCMWPMDTRHSVGKYTIKSRAYFSMNTFMHLWASMGCSAKR